MGFLCTCDRCGHMENVTGQVTDDTKMIKIPDDYRFMVVTKTGYEDPTILCGPCSEQVLEFATSEPGTFILDPVRLAEREALANAEAERMDRRAEALNETP